MKVFLLTYLFTYLIFNFFSASGHYTALLCDPSNNNVITTSDTYISAPSENTALKNAYCLFYERLEQIPSLSTHSLPSVHPISTCEEMIEAVDRELPPREGENIGDFIGNDGDAVFSASQGDPKANLERAPIVDPSVQMKQKIEDLKARENESAKNAHDRFCEIISQFTDEQLAEYVLVTNTDVSAKLAPVQQQNTEIRENIQKLKEIHRAGLKQLNHGKSNIGNLSKENPFIQAAYEFEEALEEKFQEPEMCCICLETHYEQKIGLRTRKCKRCAEEFRGAKLLGVNPKSFSMENKMIPAEIPLELQDLSFAELKLVSIATPLLHIYSRRGLSTLKGNCIGKSYT